MRYGPPDYPGVHMCAGEKRRGAGWTALTDAAEFEERVLRLAAELTAISSHPLRLLVTVMMDGENAEAIMNSVLARLGALGFEAKQNGDQNRIMVFPNPEKGWKKLQKAFPPPKKRRSRSK